MVPGISDHEHARKWQPGAGGLCLHTIVRDGNRVHLGISTGGHYLSEDGGQTFRASNKGVGAGFAPDPYPEFGQCVHKIVRHEKVPGRLYMQNHGGWADWTGPGGPRPDIGVLRSDDYGRSWRSIAKGLPSDFGFPIVAPSPRRRHGLRDAPEAGDAHLPRGRARGVAERERRRIVEPPRARPAEEGDLLHHPARRHGRRPPPLARPLLRHHHRPALDRAGTAARSSSACSTRCPRSTTSRPRWCDEREGPGRGASQGLAAVAALGFGPVHVQAWISQPLAPFFSTKANCAASRIATPFSLNVYTAGTTT